MGSNPGESPSGFSFARVPASGPSLFGGAATHTFGSFKDSTKSDNSAAATASSSAAFTQPIPAEQPRRGTSPLNRTIAVRGRGGQLSPGSRVTGAGPRAVNRRRLSNNSSAGAPDGRRSEIAKSRSLRLSGVPAALNTEAGLRAHFGRFGDLQRVSAAPRPGLATLIFASHDDALRAKMGGAMRRPGTKPMTVSWIIPATGPAKTSPKGRESEQSVPGRPGARSPGAQGRRVADQASSHAVDTKTIFPKQVLPKITPAPPPPIVTPWDRELAKAKSSTMVVQPSAPVISVNAVAAAPLGRAQIAAQLRKLIGRTALTHYDKYVLLEERDKILRKGRSRRADMRRAVAQQGTCEDMCPEKERYIREVQNRMSLYELGPEGGVDPSKCVKDYSRSSADQEEPLPHELRPAGVLGKTMAYLYGQIAQAAPADDTRLAAWYDFLWNRTRAIRKDITQQMLGDPAAVELVEQCTRLHVLASHNLAHLGVAEFDQNMNTENMTKCLQTLRHMYEDAGREGVDCPREAEFRAYDILLHLNDTDILRQVLSYSPAVRESEAVRLALRLLVAVQNNHWVRFFNLVRRRCDFLQACLAHRYFAQVRAAALQTMIKAYHATPATLYPLSELMENLGFESGDETRAFAAQHGLRVDDDEMIEFARGSFFVPASLAAAAQSFLLVSCKAGSRSVGEILYGGPIAQSSWGKPGQSFDASHAYTADDPVIQPYLDPRAAQAEEEAAARVSAAAALAERQRRERHTKLYQLTEGLIGKWLKPEITSTAESAYVASFAGEFVMSVVDGETKRLCEDTHRHLRMAAEERARESAKSERAAAVKSISTDLVSQVAAEMAREIATRHILSARQTARREAATARVEAVSARALDGLISDVAEDAIRDEFSAQVTTPLARLAQIRYNLNVIRLRQLFVHWHETAAARSRQRQILANFPACPSASLAAAARDLGLQRPRLQLQSPVSPKRLAKAIQMSRSGWEWETERRLGVAAVEALRRVRVRMDRISLKAAFRAWRATALSAKAPELAIPLTPSASLKRAADDFRVARSPLADAAPTPRKKRMSPLASHAVLARLSSWNSPPPSPPSSLCEELRPRPGELRRPPRDEGPRLWSEEEPWLHKRSDVESAPGRNFGEAAKMSRLRASLADLQTRLAEERRAAVKEAADWDRILHFDPL